MTLETKLREMGNEVYIFTIDPKVKEKIVNPNIIYFSGFTVPLKKLKSYKLAFKTYLKIKELKKYQLDVIHLQTEFSMANFAVATSKKYKIPLVYTLHTLYEDYLSYISKTIDEHFHKSFLASLAKILISPINKVATIKIVPSRKTLALISKYYIDGDVRVVPTGLNLANFTDKKKDEAYLTKLKESLNIPSTDVIYLYLGRISPEKAIDELIEAFAKAYHENNNMTFLIIGDGAILNDLKELATNLNIPKNKIKFLGFIEWNNIVPYYQIADAFLNASTSETQGLTYIEALACGTPIIVKYDEVLDDVVEVGVNGYFYQERQELVNYLIDFTTHREKIRNLKNKTYETILKFSDQVFAEKVYAIYQDAINKCHNKK